MFAEISQASRLYPLRWVKSRKGKKDGIKFQQDFR